MKLVWIVGKDKGSQMDVLFIVVVEEVCGQVEDFLVYVVVFAIILAVNIRSVGYSFASGEMSMVEGILSIDEEVSGCCEIILLLSE